MHEPLLFASNQADETGSDNNNHGADEDDRVSLALSEDRIKKRKPFPILLFAVGAFLILLGTAAPKRLDHAVDDAVWKQMRMDNNSTRGYRDFAKEVVWPKSYNTNDSREDEGDSIYLRFHVFHVVNADKHDLKSNFVIEERGPYVYKVFLQHFNISFFGEDTGDFSRSHMKEVYFKTWQQVHHIVGGPHGGKDDSELVTTVSMPYQAILAISKSLPYKALQDLVLDHFLGSTARIRREKLFVTKTVREILFGYRETFQPKRKPEFPPSHDDHFDGFGDIHLPLDVREKMKAIIEPYSNRLGKLVFSNSHAMPSDYSKGDSGIDFPGFVQNFTSMEEADSKVEFDAQRVDRAMTGTYVWYQGSSQLKRCAKDTCPPLWGSREANRVLGSNGKFWGGKDHKENLVFLSPIVRSAKVVLDNVSLSNQGSVVVDGIQCKRWILHPSVFGNVSDDPENAAYYAVNQPRGLLNVGPLLLNIPIFASKPRYLHGDRETLLTKIEGMPDPDPHLHDITFDVHEETGISVKVSERFQYNVRLEEEGRVLMPVFWFETIESMSSRNNRLFRKCDSYVQAASIFKVVGLVLGIISLVAAVTIATDRAEQDAKRAQAKAVYDHEHFHRRHLASVEHGEAFEHLVDDEEARVKAHENKQGIGLLLSSKSLREAWITTPPFVLLINVIIEIITLKDSKYVGVWRSYDGESSAALQLVLTGLFVGIFVTLSGVAVARAAFVRGEIPRKRIPFEPFSRRRCWTLPWLPTDHACGMGVLVGLTFVVVWSGTVLLLTYLFVCGSDFSRDRCTLFWAVFVVVKSVFAAIEAAIVFPIAALRALHGQLDDPEPLNISVAF